jgi:hypothetical protein
MDCDNGNPDCDSRNNCTCIDDSSTKRSEAAKPTRDDATESPSSHPDSDNDYDYAAPTKYTYTTLAYAYTNYATYYHVNSSKYYPEDYAEAQATRPTSST